MKTEDLSMQKIKSFLENGQISLAMAQMSAISEMCQYKLPDNRFRELKYKYEMMLKFYKEGVKDPQRGLLYGDYQEELYAVWHDLDISQKIEKVYVLQAAYKRALTVDLKAMLDKIAELSNLCAGQMPDANLYSETLETIAECRKKVFSYILISSSWDKSTANQIITVMSDSQFDIPTKLLMLSAIMLACMLSFDFEKFRTLVRVYQESNDVRLQQRALVGWVFSVDESNKLYYGKQKDIIAHLCENDQVASELLALQQQIIYALDTEKDTECMHNIMPPEMLSRLHKFDLGRTEDLNVDDLFELSNQEDVLERIEKKMMKFKEMEELGSDVYYEGFSQMKSFGFFHLLCNWLTPFYAENPVFKTLREKWDNGDAFLKRMTLLSPFCDSDNYSFVLACSDIVDKVPEVKNVLMSKMFLDDEAMIAEDGLLKSSLERKKYLQDLIRFFSLAPMKLMDNPFASKDRNSCIYFLSHSIFDTSEMAKMHFDLCTFLWRRKDYDRLSCFIRTQMPEDRNVLMLKAIYEIRYGQDYEKATSVLTSVLLKEPDFQPAMKLLAKCHYIVGNYQGAKKIYERLVAVSVGKEFETNELCLACCLMELGDIEKALGMLYKLDYQNPDRLFILRPLAWGLLLRGDAGKALGVYEKIFALYQENLNDEDFYSRGVAYWCSGNIPLAVEQFHRMKTKNTWRELMDKVLQDYGVLQRFGIIETDLMLMLDIVFLQNNKE